jgi:hypothetical protein
MLIVISKTTCMFKYESIPTFADSISIVFAVYFAVSEVLGSIEIVDILAVFAVFAVFAILRVALVVLAVFAVFAICTAFAVIAKLVVVEVV